MQNVHKILQTKVQTNTSQTQYIANPTTINTNAEKSTLMMNTIQQHQLQNSE